MSRQTYRATIALVAVAPLFLYACGVLKDGDDRAQLSGGDASDAQGDTPIGHADAADSAHVDATSDATVDARDAHDEADAIDATVDASDAHDSTDASDAGDATLDANDASDASDALSDTLDAPVQLDGPLGAAIPLVLGSSGFYVEGFTSDGWLAYTDLKSVSVVPLTGGNSISLVAEPADASSWVNAWVDGKVVSASVGNVAGPMKVWSQATGAHTIPDPVQELVVSNDGTRIAYNVVDTTADGSVDVYTMLSDLDLSNPVRLPGSRSMFSGLWATGDHFVIQTRSSPDPNDYSFSVESYTNGGVQIPLFQNANTTVIRVRGGTVVLYDQGHILGRTVSGGPTAIFELPADAGTDAGTIDPEYLLLTADGSRVVFADKTSAFWSSPTASPNVMPIPGMVLSNAFPSLTPAPYVDLAPNGSRLVALSSGGSGAIAMIAPTATGNVITIPQPSGVFHFGRAPVFSDDSRYLYTSYSVILNELNAVAVDTGATSRITFDVDCDAGCYAPAHGSTVLYRSKGSLYADYADNPGHPTKLADSVVRFWPNDDGTVVVYLYKDPNSEAASGLFAIGVP